MIQAKYYQPCVNDDYWKYLTPGTSDYINFWNTQHDRCLNGYKPSGGLWIPGNYYFYINFCQIERMNDDTNRKSIEIPAYRDQDHEYFLEINEAEKGGYGLIIIKARRKGFSFNNMGVLLHEYTFFPGNQVGLGSEADKYVKDFRRRTVESYSRLPKELQLQTLYNNDDILMSGWKEKDPKTKKWSERGFKSVIHWRNMDPTGKDSAFRGLSLSKVCFEEAGEWKNLIAHYNYTEECFREGASQYGVPIIGGTSNQISNESTDYMEMYNNAPDYNLKALFIPASKVYAGLPGSKSFFDYKTGQSDVKGAEEDIEARAQEKLKTGGTNKAAYYAFRQEMPLKIEHAFMLSSGTPFDLTLINEQIANLAVTKKLNIATKARLDWPKGANHKKVFGGKPEMIYDEEGDFLIASPPIEGYKNVHVGGADPYHVNDKLEEKSSEKKKKRWESKGCMYVYRRFVNASIPGDYFVANYCKRPDTKEEFYEACLKLCIFYDCQVLVEYNDEGFLTYFVDNGMQRYLKERPRAADVKYMQATNRYGLHMKAQQKMLLEDLWADYIKHHYEDIYFLELLRELAIYGSKNTDQVMASGICLIHNMDTNMRVLTDEEANKVEPLLLPHYIRGQNGKVISKGGKQKDNFKGPGYIGF